MKYLFYTFIITFLQFGVVNAESIGSTLSLQQAEDLAQKFSYSLKSINAEVQALQNKADGQHSLLLPKITLEANYKYVTEVPTLKFPGGTHMAFGDNQNYSIGPVLTWSLWDFGTNQKIESATRALGKSKAAEKDISHRQILLNVRLSYFKVQLRIEQQRLIADSLKLVESQYKDIQNRVNAGSSNRIDLLSAHKEVLNLKLQARQIQADLISDLRDLYALTGIANFGNMLTMIKVDPISSAVAGLSKQTKEKFVELDLNQHPLIKAHTANAESYRLSAEGLKANQLPKLNLFAKTSIDYPNGPILEKFNQNTIGLSLTMPIFEGSRSSSEAAEKLNLAEASEDRREQVRIDLIRDWQKSNEQLIAFRDKIDIYKNSISESEERSKLVYASYRIGRSSFLDVQSANLHALETKVQSTTNDVQILIQMAYLASISEEQKNE
jgi:outer membrane protein